MLAEPTRELVLQVGSVLAQTKAPIKHALIYGGSSYHTQRAALQACDVVIATPGRLTDLLARRWVDLSALEMLVIDEADRLLDMGFSVQVNSIVKACPGKRAKEIFLNCDSRVAASRQTIMFSATMPDWCQKLAATNMKADLETIDLVTATTGTTSMVPSTVRHIAALAHPGRGHMEPLLKAVIESVGGGRTLVFASSRIEVETITSALPGSMALHGGKTQNERERVLSRFRKGALDILVATDVASRGLDITNVKNVIQLRPVARGARQHPIITEDYVHRSGRVGRAGQAGTSVVIHHGTEARALRDLERDAGIVFEQHDFRHIEPVGNERHMEAMDRVRPSPKERRPAYSMRGYEGRARNSGADSRDFGFSRYGSAGASGPDRSTGFRPTGGGFGGGYGRARERSTSGFGGFARPERSQGARSDDRGRGSGFSRPRLDLDSDGGSHRSKQ